MKKPNSKSLIPSRYFPYEELKFTLFLVYSLKRNAANAADATGYAAAAYDVLAEFIIKKI